MLFPGGSLSAVEVTKLRRVCRTACEERGVALESAEAAAIARHVMKLFMNGLSDEDELVDTMRRTWRYLVH
jgi:hypothetical protein